MGIELQDEDISLAKRLTTYNKSVEGKITIKFTCHSIRDEFYGTRKTIPGKEVGKVCTLQDLSQDPKKKLFIFGSLTQARKKLFGRINKFKKDNKWEHNYLDQQWANIPKACKETGTNVHTFMFNCTDELAHFTSKFSPG